MNYTALPREQAPGKVLKTREDVRTLFPSADSWLETQHGAADFIFCTNPLPSWGNSEIEIHGWVFRSYSKRWEKILFIRADGAGKVLLSIDPKTGLLTARGSVNNEFMNQIVCTFDLNIIGI
jgi:hypothetical protein